MYRGEFGTETSTCSSWDFALHVPYSIVHVYMYVLGGPDFSLQVINAIILFLASNLTGNDKYIIQYKVEFKKFKTCF